jgi:hypothetical protein
LLFTAFCSLFEKRFQQLMKKIISSWLLAFLFFSCTSTEEKLPKVWFFISSEAASKTEGAKGNLPVDLSSLSFLNLHPDGTYTAYLSSFEYGRWLVNDEQLVLENHNKKELILPIWRIGNDELVFTLRDQVYHFEGFANDFASAAEKPFSKENNEWRIKAEHKESEKEIALRLKNHFRFWEKYFAWALKTEKEILNVRSLPSPLKLYSNGFAVIPHEEQSPKWISNFYDTTDSRIAFDKINDLLVKEDIDWPNTKNRFKLFVSAFQQLQEKITPASIP